MAAAAAGSKAKVVKASTAAAASAVRYLHLTRLHFLSGPPAAGPSEAGAARVSGACHQLCGDGRCRDSSANGGRPPGAQNWGRGICASSAVSQSQAGGQRVPIPAGGPGLRDFMRQGALASPDSAISDCKSTQVPYLDAEPEFVPKHRGRMYVETYGCQMNVNDMEVVLAIMKDAGFSEVVSKPEEADVIFINTCAIRENAEHKIWHRLGYFKHLKTRWNRNIVESGMRPDSPPRVAVLGCMAERLKEKLIESDKLVDVVCGPDAYRDLPRLLAQVDEGHRGVNTLLSLEETYADVSPVRISKSPISAFVSIMRGCNNMCSYCIVPFTRGRERSRPVDSIVREVGELWEQGVKEVMLLGQNVNSYNDTSGNSVKDWFPGLVASTGSQERHIGEGGNPILEGNPSKKREVTLSAGFSSICKVKDGGLRFVNLLDCLSNLYPQMRFRFTSPHPKDFPDELLFLMAERPNICNSIHLPAQSGSSTVLERMRRGYTREAYLALVSRVRDIVPHVSISSDFITGFCGETEEEHRDTLSLVEAVGYDMAYMFAYSMREKTHAHRNYCDDVEPTVKQRRLAELIATFRASSKQRFESLVGSTQLVLVEGPNKRNPTGELIGRNDMGHKVVFPNVPISVQDYSGLPGNALGKAGDYVDVRILDTGLASLKGEAVVLKDGLSACHAS